MATALLLIDIQTDYFPGGDWELDGMEAAAARAAALLARFREAGRTVVHVRHEFESADAPFFRPGEPGASIHASVAPRPGEVVITKHAVNAFQQTPLQPRLRGLGIDELVIVGAMSHMCIQGTTRAAADLGLACRVVHDACATRELEFDGRTVPARDVHASAMATLGFGFAGIVGTEEVLSTLDDGAATDTPPRSAPAGATPGADARPAPVPAGAPGAPAAPADPAAATVTLRELDQGSLVPVLSLDVAPAQRGFVANNAVSVAQAHVCDHAWARAIYADEVPVGFVMLSDNPEDEGPWLWRFMIDHRFQRCGYGRRALEQVFDHVRTTTRPDALFTSVVEGDGGPRPFYESLGFRATGAVEDDETVLRLDLAGRR